MRLLLDTRAFLWFVGGSDELSITARRLIEDTNNQRFSSVASLGEMAIKVSLGKLKLAMSFVDFVQREVRGNAIELLAVSPDHLDELAKLLFHNRDPFDRMIVAQGLAESIPIISRDEAFERYPVNVVWQDDRSLDEDDQYGGVTGFARPPSNAAASTKLPVCRRARVTTRGPGLEVLALGVRSSPGCSAACDRPVDS